MTHIILCLNLLYFLTYIMYAIKGNDMEHKLYT